jgi:tetratricopeptide (TPR) repeat protein
MTTPITHQPSPHDSDPKAVFRRAKQAYEADPENSPKRRAMGWALANLLKDVSGNVKGSPDRLVRGLAVISEFPMDPADLRWRESVLWSVNRFLLRVQPTQLSLANLAEIISHARAFVEPTPSLVRSVWWKALLRHSAAGIDWLGLFAELGWEGGFRPDDEQPETYGEGKSQAPLVERVIQAVLKQLLKTVPLTDEQAEPWLTRLTELTGRYPDWPFLPYYQARLLQQLNRPDKAMAVFLPFARRKKQTGRAIPFWVWSLLADLVPAENVDNRLACYARALSLNTPETFLVKVRQQLAALLIGLGRWNDARNEIERLLQTRQTESWPIPAEVNRWMNDTCYTQAVATPSAGWYASLSARADALLWADAPEHIALVTGVDATGQYCNLAIDAQTTGSFPCGKFGLKPAVGDRLAVRYETQVKNNRLQVFIQTATAVSAPCSHLHPRLVEGPLRLMPAKSAGFVSDVYVPAELLGPNRAWADRLVWVEAIESWDVVKKKTGWRAFRINIVS